MPPERTANEIAHAKAVRDMFSGISSKYDFLNHFLSLNIDKRWRRLVAEKLNDILQNKNAIVLDVACGTGDLSLELQKRTTDCQSVDGQADNPSFNTGARIIGSDFCRPMLSIAKEKTEKVGSPIPYIEADAMNLSFADESFDAVTIAFGLRNLANFEDGLRELHRVLKKGGRLAVLEFSIPVFPSFRQLFSFYFARVLPRIGGIVSGSQAAYEYLPDSVSRFPDQKHLAELMRQTGFSDVEYKNLTGGIAALHLGTKKL